MKPTRMVTTLLVMLGLLAPPVEAAPSAAVAGLRVGAAKIDITPPAEELVEPFKSVADRIFVRAVAIESGGKTAIVIIADVPTIGDRTLTEMVDKVAAQSHVPRAAILLGTSHTHNAIRVDPATTGIILPGSPKFVERVTAATLEAVRQAQARLQPARAGLGRGKVHLVGNRNQWSAAQGRYITGVDRTGTEPINEALGVMKFETLDGKPIAMMLNYAIEPVIAMAIPAEISGDVPGMASRMIEERLGTDAVALFTVGAAGTPLYRAEDAGADKRTRALSLMTAMGTILAEEALAVGNDLSMSANAIRIAAAAKQLICPGKATTPYNLPNRCAYTPGSTLPPCEFKDRDADPVALNLGMIRIGDLVLTQADANVTPALGQKFARQMPLSNSWIVALTYGPMRYVMDDAAYAQNTYEATATTAKKGCAEQGFLQANASMAASIQ
ncbi:hypothetical protein WBP07_25500 [Novosphingobium sp. BL-8A]|uniref:hypothetical protein n=1 Tax=Novosphingobium sp. BL-8A TaxID=3127639 RepID=UPI0037581C99